MELVLIKNIYNQAELDIFLNSKPYKNYVGAVAR